LHCLQHLPNGDLAGVGRQRRNGKGPASAAQQQGSNGGGQSFGVALNKVGKSNGGRNQALSQGRSSQQDGKVSDGNRLDGPWMYHFDNS
jgi:hypothetical protein